MRVPGEKATEFRLKRLDGGDATLESLRAGRGALLVFFKVACPTCQFTLPFLERLSRQEQLPLVAISQDAAKPTREFHQEFGITLPTLLDGEEQGYRASNGFGIAHVPSLFVVEPDGTISWALEGFHKQALEDLGTRVGVAPFRPGEYVPEWKAG